MDMIFFHPEIPKGTSFNLQMHECTKYIAMTDFPESLINLCRQAYNIIKVIFRNTLENDSSFCCTGIPTIVDDGITGRKILLCDCLLLFIEKSGIQIRMPDFTFITQIRKMCNQ